MRNYLFSVTKERGNNCCFAPKFRSVAEIARMFTFFLAFVFVMPSIAQEEAKLDSTPESISEATVKKPDSNKVEDNEENTQGSNLPLIISLVAIALSVFSLVSLYQRKKMKEISDIPGKIAEMANAIEKMKAQIEEIKGEISTLQKKQNDGGSVIVDKPHPSSRKEENQQPIITHLQEHKPEFEPTLAKHEEAKVPIKRIYANGKDTSEKITLETVEDRFEAQAAFVITAKGNIGTYSFNNKATAGILKYLGTMVNPYSETVIDPCVIPSIIETVEEGTVEQQGALWVVTKKAHIKVK